MKRDHDDYNDERPSKRRAVEHVQELPAHTEMASQIAEHPDLQLMRSITAACTLAGFDTMTTAALEMFRAHTAEYMIRFAREVRLSMQGQRRTRPTTQDFSMALSRSENTRAPRVLRPQMNLRLPKEISYPSIPAPNPALDRAPDFSALLAPLIERRPPEWIPSHFPSLPPQHAWRATIVVPERERDARKLREKATEEGMLAEQALRKLAAAAKAGSLKADVKRREAQAVMTGPGKARAAERRKADNDDIFGEVLAEVASKASTGDHDEGGGEENKSSASSSLDLSEGMLVDASAMHWRGGKRQGLAF